MSLFMSRSSEDDSAKSDAGVVEVPMTPFGPQ
jgi:hypothetical protein